jgi:nucleotide-binding universal stress UspA family protein
MADPIVLGYDESPSANAALAATVRIAPAAGAKVVVVFGYYISPLGGLQHGSIQEALEHVGRHAVGRAVADLEAVGVEVESRLVSGKPAEVLIDVAKEVGASAIVVGTVGENPVTGAILGSVVLRLVQRSPLPILVVPTEHSE